MRSLFNFWRNFSAGIVPQARCWSKQKSHPRVASFRFRKWREAFQ